MKLVARLSSKLKKDDTRDLEYWVERLKLKAEDVADPYVLAAIHNALTGSDPELLKAIETATARCVEKHTAAIRKQAQSL